MKPHQRFWASIGITGGCILIYLIVTFAFHEHREWRMENPTALFNESPISGPLITFIALWMVIGAIIVISNQYDKWYQILLGGPLVWIVIIIGGLFLGTIWIIAKFNNGYDRASEYLIKKGWI